MTSTFGLSVFMASPYLLAYALAPSLPAAALGLSAGGNAKIGVFDGDAPSGTIELQASPVLDPAVWTPVHSQAPDGLGFVFEDLETAAFPSRLFRAVSKP